MIQDYYFVQCGQLYITGKYSIGLSMNILSFSRSKERMNKVTLSKDRLAHTHIGDLFLIMEAVDVARISASKIVVLNPEEDIIILSKVVLRISLRMTTHMSR